MALTDYIDISHLWGFAAVPALALLKAPDVKDKIIDKLKNTAWETKPEDDIKRYRYNMKALKIQIPGISLVLKEFLRAEMNKPPDPTDPNKGGINGGPLAKKLFDQYFDKGGADYTLTRDEMASMNQNPHPAIDIKKTNWVNKTSNPKFDTACLNAQKLGGPQDYTGDMAWACENGAIAQYVVHYTGTVTAANGTCTWEGTVRFEDRFNLDPFWKWSATNKGGRSVTGERQTRIGYILNLGDDFNIKSVTANVYQRQYQSGITFLAAGITKAPPPPPDEIPKGPPPPPQDG
jgi:hypothetical protein